ncbi:MAG: TolC family protein [Candidatus Sumerlaeia bacterium]|nr:TolC family protein [Candidatus Sumerlaeia bacterium]
MRAPEPGERPVGRPSLAIASAPAPEFTDSLVLAGAVSPGTAAPGDLQALVAQTLERNPGLRAAWLEYEAALQRIPQVTALGDPEIQLMGMVNENDIGRGPRRFEIGLMQRFPWFDVLSLQGQVAFHEALEKQAQYLTQVLDTVRQVQGLWWELAFQAARREIAREEQEILGGIAEIASSTAATGTGPLADIVGAETEEAQIEEELINVEQRVATLTAEINELRDVPPGTSVGEPSLSDASLALVDADVEALLASAELMRPEVTEIRHRIERQLRERSLARRRGYPQFMVGVEDAFIGSRDESMPEDENFEVVLGATIPLWRSAYRAGVAESQRNLDASHAMLRETSNRVAQEVQSAHFARQEALDLMDLYAGVLIPQAETRLEFAQSAFSTGESSLVELLDAERVLVRLRLAHEQARRDYLLALADLERAVGAALAGPSTAPLHPGVIAGAQ